MAAPSRPRTGFVALFAVVTITGATIFFVHRQQTQERQVILPRVFALSLVYSQCVLCARRRCAKPCCVTLRSWAGNIYRRASHWPTPQREQSRLPRCSAAHVPCSKRAELLQGTSSPSTRLRLVAAPFSTASMLILLSDLVVWYLSGQLLSAGTVCHTVFSVQRNHKSQEQKKCCHGRAHR